MKKLSGKKALIIFIVLIILLFPVSALTGRTGNNELNFVAFFPHEFSMTFIHSMYHKPQVSHYLIQNNNLVLEQVDFYSFDELAYFDPLKADTYKQDTDGIWRVKFNEPLKKDTIRQAYGTPYTFMLDGKKITFFNQFKGGTKITFATEKIALYKVLYGLVKGKFMFFNNLV